MVGRSVVSRLVGRYVGQTGAVGVCEAIMLLLGLAVWHLGLADVTGVLVTRSSLLVAVFARAILSSDGASRTESSGEGTR